MLDPLVPAGQTSRQWRDAACIRGGSSPPPITPVSALAEASFPAQNARADASWALSRTMNDEAVRTAAEELAQKVARQALSVGEQRACEAELSELRLAWKRNP